MNLFIALFVVVMLGAGVLFLFYPEKIRDRDLKWYAEQRNPVLRWNPFLPWMKTGSYIVAIRFCGVLAFVMAALSGYALVRRILGE